MRCRFRRLISCLCLFIILIIFYRNSISNKKFSQNLSLFQKIEYKNKTYRILSPSYQYDSHGIYLNFAYFNVEQRQRVLYIDYLYDIPVSSQWKSKGHIYPIQIAQFGLSHWSRWLSNSMNKLNHIHQFEQIQTINSCSSDFIIKNLFDLSNSYIYFEISLNCSLHVHFVRNNIELIYSTMSIYNQTQSNQIRIFLQGSPRQVNRYMLIDIEKFRKEHIRFRQDSLRIYFCSQSNFSIPKLIIGNQTLYNQKAFESATKWLLNHQDLITGCWFISIPRKFGKYKLRMPWCSAMAQGQISSLLVRLYSRTKNLEYLSAIHRAVRPLWSSNITRAYFNQKYLWLEEYPLNSSTNGLFVLNGCLYTLIGIIDIYTIDPQPYLSELINQILISLEHMLPLYVHSQISNWSLYDLSHLTLKTQVNTASFSYHLVHITLLQCLSQIFRKTHPTIANLFHSYAQRFQSVIK